MAPLSLLSAPLTLTLLHDPDSPASEYALQALQLGCQQFDVRRPMLGEALSESELRDVADRLVGDPVDALVRRGRHYRALGLDVDGASTDEVVDTLVAHPELLQLPILDDGESTMVGRPARRAEAWAVTGHVTDYLPVY